jgi:hypothetical protein
MWVKRLARALGNSFSYVRISVQCFNNWFLQGMAHAPTFCRTTTHLLCPAAVGAKYLRARVWGTPVVDMRWLAHIAKTGALPTTGMFLVPTPHAPDVETSDVINCTRCIPVADIMPTFSLYSEVTRPGARRAGSSFTPECASDIPATTRKYTTRRRLR